MYSIYELLPKELKDMGYTKDVIYNIYKQLYIKKPIEVYIEEVQDEAVQVNSLEGLVMAMPGMYIATGIKGEKFVITKDILDTIYDKVENKENTYIKKPYPIIAEKKEETFVVQHENANGGYLKGKAGDYMIQSMIKSTYIYPIDCEIFNESYIPYIDFLRERYGIWEEQFEEEVYSYPVKKETIFSKIYTYFQKFFIKEESN